mmetsp:Transcript_6995/g.20430  ORF Transcript_6995/g.20430 Transcript_6995/m.20430 type:complete len:180 (-) Transcript_6995:101-640(-)
MAAFTTQTLSGPTAAADALSLIVERAVGLTQSGNFDAFAVVDLSFVARKLRRWRELFPDVRPFFAMKVNPDPGVIAALIRADAGASPDTAAGFDCASIGEINAVLAAGAAPERIIYAHPVKTAEDLDFALNAGITFMTLDSVGELDKIEAAAARAKAPQPQLGASHMRARWRRRRTVRL